VIEMANNNIDMSQVISDFRKWGGSNYRVARNNPEEKQTYEKLKKADTDPDNAGQITLYEYLEYLQQTCPHLNITRENMAVAKDADIFINVRNESWDAVERLVGYQDKNIVPIFIESAHNEKSPIMQERIYDALGKIGDKATIKYLVTDLNTASDPRVRDTIAAALCKLGEKYADNKAISAFANAVSNGIIKKDYAMFLVSINRIEDKRLIPLYKASLNNPGILDEGIFAASTLAKLEGEKALPLIMAALTNNTDWLIENSSPWSVDSFAYVNVQSYLHIVKGLQLKLPANYPQRQEVGKAVYRSEKILKEFANY
jgi:hypothetical protein